MNSDILNNIEDTYDNITTTPEVGKCYEKIYKNGKIKEVYLGRFVMRETDNLSDTRWQSMNPNMIGKFKYDKDLLQYPQKIFDRVYGI